MARAVVRLILVVLIAGAGAAAGASLWHPASASGVDTTYTAVTPCVVFDSRASQGATGGFLGPINGGQVVTYLATGTFPSGQGGGNTTCGIPVGASSVEINVVAVNALNEGNLRVTDGTPTTSGGAVNYNNLTPKLNTANAVIVPLDATGHLVVTTNCGAGCVVDSTEVRGIVLGYFTDGLANRVAALEALLQDVTRTPAGIGGQDTLRFSGMNVQIVDGSGTTECNDGTGNLFDGPCNGQGNLVVGYAENLLAYARTGSHNMVGGHFNGWTSYGGAVLGEQNRITNDYATVLGGAVDVASGAYTVVAGGRNNQATTSFAVVVGGEDNTASSVAAAIFGGNLNQATGNYTTVLGGHSNTATGFATTVSGGGMNTAGGAATSISGGIGNVADDTTCGNSQGGATVTGGRSNLSNGCQTAVSGGYQNTASDGTCAGTLGSSSVTGGRDNVASGCFATVTGGGGDDPNHLHRNTASGDYSTVNGGRSNTASGVRGSVTGGADNLASGANASVNGGQNNDATNNFATVSGGANRAALGAHDWWGGGMFQDF